MISAQHLLRTEYGVQSNNKLKHIAKHLPSPTSNTYGNTEYEQYGFVIGHCFSLKIQRYPPSKHASQAQEAAHG
jgi:hypothetical protein